MAHELDQLRGERNYKGCLVGRLIGGGYLIFGKVVETPEDVDKLIWVAAKAIEDSLTVSVTNRSGSFSVLNTEGDTMYPSEGI